MRQDRAAPVAVVAFRVASQKKWHTRFQVLGEAICPKNTSEKLPPRKNHVFMGSTRATNADCSERLRLFFGAQDSDPTSVARAGPQPSPPLMAMMEQKNHNHCIGDGFIGCLRRRRGLSTSAPCGPSSTQCWLVAMGKLVKKKNSCSRGQRAMFNMTSPCQPRYLCLPQDL